MLRVLVGLGTTEPMTVCIVHVSAIEFNVPAVPELIVPDKLRTGESTTAELIITGVVPVLVVVPVAFVNVTVVVVEAVNINVPLFPVAPPVYPLMVTEAPAHALEPAPDSVAARVYTHTLP